jgi:hypothetical protein
MQAMALPVYRLEIVAPGYSQLSMKAASIGRGE